MNDLAIKEFEAQIVRVINEAQLPLEVKRLIVAEIYANLNAATNDSVNVQLREREAAKDSDDEKKVEE